MVLNYSTLFFPLYHTTYITGVDGDDYDGGGGGDGEIGVADQSPSP
jgi:hypothetical protein